MKRRLPLLDDRHDDIALLARVVRERIVLVHGVDDRQSDAAARLDADGLLSLSPDDNPNFAYARLPQRKGAR